MKKNVCIVGSHPRGREAVDWNRDCDYWLFNEAARMDWVKKCDAVFQMHAPVIWKNPNNRNDPEHYNWLKTQTITPVIYMQDHYNEIPASVKYPIDQAAGLLESLHIENRKAQYFNSSVDYAIALAICLGYETIDIYGVELETQTEYFYQRSGFTFWVGVAIGRGIKVINHNLIFDAPLYGYGGEVVLNYNVFVERVAELQSPFEALKAQYEVQTKAAGDAFEEFVKAGTKEAASKFHQLNSVQRELGQQLSKLDGQLQENRRYIGKADAMKETAGEFAFSRQEFEGTSAQMHKLTTESMAHANVAGGRAEVAFNTILNTGKEKHRRKKAGEFVAHMQEHMKHLFYSALYMGAYEENMAYLKRLDALIKAAGGAKSEAVMLEAMK